MDQRHQTHFIRHQIIYVAGNQSTTGIHWPIQKSTFYGERAIGEKGKPFTRDRDEATVSSMNSKHYLTKARELEMASA